MTWEIRTQVMCAAKRRSSNFKQSAISQQIGLGKEQCPMESMEEVTVSSDSPADNVVGRQRLKEADPGICGKCQIKIEWYDVTKFCNRCDKIGFLPT